MMSFPPYLGLSPPGGLCEDRSLSQLFLYPPGVDPAGLYKGPLRNPPGLLPYLPPFPHPGPFSVCECPLEPAFIQKRNERERERVRCVNRGYARLRDLLPGPNAQRRLSKVETLRAAIRYIRYLQSLVEAEGREAGPESPRATTPAEDLQGEEPTTT